MTRFIAPLNTVVQVRLKGVLVDISLARGISFLTTVAEATQYMLVTTAFVKMVIGIPPLGPLIALEPV